MTTYAQPFPVPQADSRKQKVREGQIKVLFQYLPVQIAAQYIAATLELVVLWDVAPRLPLLIWYGTIIVALTSWAPFVWLFHRGSVDKTKPGWRLFVLGAALFAGIWWGGGAVVLFPSESFAHQMLLLFLLVCLGAGALSSSVYLPQFYSFFPLALLPVTVVLFTQGTEVHNMVGLFLATFIAIFVFFARQPGQTLVNMLTLQLENADLVDQLRVQKAEAEQANIAKSKFLAAASHDLRQPLHALMLFTSALDEKIKAPDLQRIVDNVKTSLGSMQELFNALLDISQLDADVLQPAINHFDLSALAERLANDFGPEAAEKGLVLQIAACDVIVRSDATLLERVLRNLVANAIRYTERGEVLVRCEQLPDEVRIDVIDTGVGIPVEQQREIFTEFHQLGNAERDRAKGLGLGLAIVHRIARLLGHSIDLDSSPGAGSRFSITVPAGDSRQVASEETTWVEAVSGELTGLRVMIVDDEVAVREGMSTLLGLWGCDVTTAGSEDEAVDTTQASGSPPDALVVDYRLRDERTGVQAIERMQNEFGCDIPALIITGDTAADRLREAKGSGFELVHKPVQPAMLRAFLRNVRKQQRG